jgi:hypothetical protein
MIREKTEMYIAFLEIPEKNAVNEVIRILEKTINEMVDRKCDRIMFDGHNIDEVYGIKEIRALIDQLETIKKMKYVY